MALVHLLSKGLLYYDISSIVKELSINARISSARQTVVQGLNFMGFGKRLSLGPCHKVDLDTGMTAGTVGLALGGFDDFLR